MNDLSSSALLCCSLTHTGIKLSSLSLISFGGKASSNERFGEDQIGLDISTLPLMVSDR